MDNTEYVDGGLYATETPGSDGKGYSTGRGGAGNVRGPEENGREHVSDRMDDITVESLVHPPAEGEGYSTGRGGLANVHPQRAPAHEEDSNGSHSGQMARLGLAYGTR